MELHYIIIGIVVIVIVLFQLNSFFINRKKIKSFRTIFPNIEKEGFYSILKDENDEICSITTNHDNQTLSTIILAINNYLEKNRAAVSDFHLIKDIVERNCSINEDEINTVNPMPLYLGLIGTMAGILIGVLFLVFGGGLDLLFGVEEISYAGEEAKGVIQLLGGVGVAMTASLLGIILTISGSVIMNTAKNEIETNKNAFFSWVQAELLPELCTDTTNTLHLLSRNLTKFNSTFSTNTQELGETLKQINTSYKNQADLMKAIDKIKMQDIASANINVLKELQECTGEIGQFNQYLHAVTGYLTKVETLTQTVNDHLDRTKVIEEMGRFFKDEIEQIDSRKSAISKSVGLIDDTLQRAISKLQENADQQFDELIKATTIQHTKFGKAVEEQQNALQNKLTETSGILEELHNLTEVKTSMINLEESTNQQNKKLDTMISAIQELAGNQPADRPSSNERFSKEVPYWIKIAGITCLGLVSASCLFFLIINILSIL